MDTFNEKKWFVYVGDHHEGPFSVAEIQGKLHDGQVNQGSYAWAEGLADWKLMTEIQDFAPIFSTSGESTRPTSPPPPHGAAQTPFSPMDASIEPASMAIHSEGVSDEPAFQSEPDAASDVLLVREDGPEPVSPAGHRRSRVIKWAIALMIPLIVGILALQGMLDPLLNRPGVQAMTRGAGAALQPFLLGLVEKFPALSHYISPLPRLDDVEDLDNDALAQAARANLGSEGPKVAIALSKGDMLAPQFYVASNLPDGTVFGIAIVGVADSLLNATQMTVTGDVTLAKKLGKSPALRAPGGKALPRGSYEVFVWETDKLPSEAQAALAKLPAVKNKLPESAPLGRKLAEKRVYFLGGPKDSTYGQRLKEYHDKLKEKATGELTELKMFAATLENSFNESVTEFQKLRALKNKKLQQKTWGDFHARWSQMDSQLQVSFQKWTPETLADEYFYPMLYRATQVAGQSVAKVHGIHHAFFTGALDVRSVDIQQGEALAGAKQALDSLKIKIDQAEKIPASPNGMPRRDGL